jgi:hypothetical protein
MRLDGYSEGTPEFLRDAWLPKEKYQSHLNRAFYEIAFWDPSSLDSHRPARGGGARRGLSQGNFCRAVANFDANDSHF